LIHVLASSIPKILFFISEDWYFCSHRLPIARAARDAGFEVAVACRVREDGEVITREGFRLIPIPFRRGNINPFQDIASLATLVRIYGTECPDIVHHVAMKPVVFGSLAARMTGIPFQVNALAGLGYIFSSTDVRAKLLKPFIVTAFRALLNHGSCKVILQNPNDIETLTGTGVLSRDKIALIRGSGVNLDVFHPTLEPPGKPIVILASRMLRDKGVVEFVETARLLLHEGSSARFALVGDADPDNPSSLSVSQLREWHDSGFVEWWGYRKDMPQVFAQSHIVCLPSYREGLPKVLIEAAACGRPIVATDVPGCREIVRQDENGILVPVRKADALARALKKLIDDPGLRQKMGERGRTIAEKEFSEEKIVLETLSVYRELLQSRKP